MLAARKQVIVSLVLIVLLTGVATWVFNRLLPTQPNRPATPSAENGKTAVFATSSPSVSQSLKQSPSPAPLDPDPVTIVDPLKSSYVGNLFLIVPVMGVRRDQIIDTFADARSEGRIHDAIDIQAPANTPVVAAADGEVVKLFQSELGGITIYQSSSDKKLIFYYAHLARYADGLVEGKLIRQGETIAYVGDTGNAGTGNFHLHFSIAVVADPKRYWEGTNINPYPLLHH